MKLFVDAHIFDDSYQGIRTYIQGLYSELISLAPDIDFYFGAYDVCRLAEVFGHASNVHYIPFKSLNKFYRLSIDIPHIIQKYKIDIAHYQYISPLYKCCKEIVTIHDVLFLDYPDYFPLGYRLKNNFLFSRSAKRADLLLTVSDYSKGAIARHFKIPYSNIAITPNGVSSFFANKVEKLIDIKKRYNLDKYILCVGRIEPRKNHIFLTKAFEELHLWEKGYDLVLIGKKEKFENSFDRYLNGLSQNVTDHIKIIEQVDNDELKVFYKEASLFVFPSLAEGFGIPPIEAVLSGTPCLCSNATAMQDFSFLGRRLFDPKNINELKEKILYELSLKDKGYGAEVEQIERLYNWRNIAQSFQQLIQKRFS